MASSQAEIFIIIAIFNLITKSSSEASPPYGIPAQEAEPPNAHRQYVYTYDVRDSQSGVYTSKQETRYGDYVYGTYLVEEPDGTIRTVIYRSDPERGLTADVQRRPSESPAPANLERLQPIPIPIVHIPLPVVQTYLAPPPPPSLPLLHHVQIGTPIAYSLAPTILTKPSSQQLESEPPRSYTHTSFTSPTHSYSY